MPGRPWFRPKRYGLGFSPASWQGWLSTAAYIAIVCALAATLAKPQPWVFWTLFVLATAVFLVVVLLTRQARR